MTRRTRGRAAFGLAVATVLALAGVAVARRPPEGPRPVSAPSDPAPSDAAPPAGPSPPGPASIDPRAVSCGGCHVQQYEEWGRSMHRHSATNRFYVAAQRLDQEPFCDSCHAPRGTEPVAARVADGVDCASCHLRGGTILASRVTDAGRRVHSMRASSELSSSRFCAGCHEFRSPPFERGLGLSPGTFMQRTFTEHQASPAAARGATCQSCHMPSGDHSTLGLRDPDFVASALALQVDARRATDYGTVVDVTLTAHDVGHAFPTGDMLRALEVRVAGGAATRTVTLSRVFRVTPEARGLVEVEDRRLVPDVPRRLTFHLATRPASVVVSVGVLRAPLRDASAQGLDPDELRVPVRTIEVEVRQ